MPTENGPRIAEGHDFRMGGWVTQLNNATGTLRYYLAVDHDDGTKRRLALILKRPAGYLYRLFEEVLVNVAERCRH